MEFIMDLHFIIIMDMILCPQWVRVYGVSCHNINNLVTFVRETGRIECNYSVLRVNLD